MERTEVFAVARYFLGLLSIFLNHGPNKRDIGARGLYPVFPFSIGKSQNNLKKSTRIAPPDSVQRELSISVEKFFCGHFGPCAAVCSAKIWGIFFGYSRILLAAARRFR